VNFERTSLQSEEGRLTLDRTFAVPDDSEESAVQSCSRRIDPSASLDRSHGNHEKINKAGSSGMNLIMFLIIGLAAGWFAGQLMKSGDGGVISNLIVGVIGAMIGGVIFRFLSIAATGAIGELISATVGAMVLIWGLRTLIK